MAKRRRAAASKDTAETQAPGDLTRRIVYVHGIGRHDGADSWKRTWDIALFGRSMGNETLAAYWADILHGDAPARTSARSPRTHATDDERAVFETSLRSRFLRAETAAGGAYDTKALPLPEFLRTPVARAFLERFVKDTAAYFYDVRARREMRNRVLKVIRALGDDAFVLVTHSQGSMIAYDVLHELGRDCTVSRFVTLGSPLGIQEVQDRLRKLLQLPPGPLPIPAGIQRWDNFAARFDPVAADPVLADDYDTVRPIIRDHRIDNPYTWRLRGFNPHDSRGIWPTPTSAGSSTGRWAMTSRPGSWWPAT